MLPVIANARRSHDPAEAARELGRARKDQALANLGVAAGGTSTLGAVEADVNALLAERGYQVRVLGIAHRTLTVAVDQADRTLIDWDRDIILTDLTDRHPELRIDRLQVRRER